MGFADKYAKKGGNTITQLTKEHKSTIDSIKPNEPQKASKESFSDKNSEIDPIKKSQASLIYLVKGVDDNRNAWYYVLVERLKLSMFLKALNDDIIHLENYGKILYSAYGDEPPENVTDKLKKEYGIQ
ncbi:MAG: methionyl-tRNA formyltransferase [Myxococcota bacterium]|jgi:methionyl-tRNA formyltransferase